MMTRTWLGRQYGFSPLNSQNILRPKAMTGGGKSLLAGLMLTSLVDAFSILVIFLLMNTNSTIEEMQLGRGDQIPVAFHSSALKKGLLVDIDQNSIEIEGKSVRLSELTRSLQDAAASRSVESEKVVVIKASKRTGFEQISPVLVAASQAELQNFRLVVIDPGQM